MIRIGGRDTTQEFIQQRLSLRDDYTRYITWHGIAHVKCGVVLSFLNYDVTKLPVRQSGVPLPLRRAVRVSVRSVATASAIPI